MKTAFILIFLSLSAFAQDLKGNMTDEGNGIYTIAMRDANGVWYRGEAEDYGDGKLHVVLHDPHAQTYYGTIHDLGDNQYGLRVENEITNVETTGVVYLNKKSCWR